MNAAQLQAFQDALDHDDAECHKMRAGGAKVETITSATGKAVGAGITLKAIMAAFWAALSSGGGVQAIIAAILALIATPAKTP